MPRPWDEIGRKFPEVPADPVYDIDITPDKSDTIGNLKDIGQRALFGLVVQLPCSWCYFCIEQQ